MPQHDRVTPPSAPAGLSLVGRGLRGHDARAQRLRAGRVQGRLPPPQCHRELRRVRDLWVGAWIALLAVGALVWGLIGWCVVAYRRRRDDNELPVQLRYNVPLEILYTIVPIFMIAVFFFYTARDQTALLDTEQDPAVTVNVIGKQWAWDFNYLEGDVHEVGTRPILTGEPGAEKTIPTIYLPWTSASSSSSPPATSSTPSGSRSSCRSSTHPGPGQQVPGGPHRGGHLQGQVRRALRRLPLPHAVQRQGRAARRVRRAPGRPEGQGQTGLLGTDLNREGSTPRRRELPRN